MNTRRADFHPLRIHPSQGFGHSLGTLGALCPHHCQLVQHGPARRHPLLVVLLQPQLMCSSQLLCCPFLGHWQCPANSSAAATLPSATFLQFSFTPHTAAVPCAAEPQLPQRSALRTRLPQRSLPQATDPTVCLRRLEADQDLLSEVIPHGSRTHKMCVCQARYSFPSVFLSFPFPSEDCWSSQLGTEINAA